LNDRAKTVQAVNYLILNDEATNTGDNVDRKGLANEPLKYDGLKV